MNALRDSLTLACLVAVGTALLAACGGSGERGEEAPAEGEGFAAAADLICAEVARNDIAARREAGGSQAEYLRQLQRNREQALRALEQLSPPADDAARYEEFLARRQASVSGIADGIAAADAGAFDRFRVAARQRAFAAQRVAAELGLSACAGTLPESERAEVEAAITSSVDAGRAEEFCIRHTSEAMIATHFGTRARCLAEQSRRAASETVAVVELQGVAGVSADAIVELGVGGGEPARYELALVHEGGSWRYESVSPAPEP